MGVQDVWQPHNAGIRRRELGRGIVVRGHEGTWPWWRILQGMSR